VRAARRLTPGDGGCIGQTRRRGAFSTILADVSVTIGQTRRRGAFSTILADVSVTVRKRPGLDNDDVAGKRRVIGHDA